jgi:single-stranded-DNA-specific exonuclease
MNWIFKPSPAESEVNALQSALKIPRIIAHLLVQRGIKTFEEARLFFKPTLNDLHNPFLMKDMDKAVERILKAINNHENIMVYGDYDVDGTTAVALLSSFLKKHSKHIQTYIPDRYSEGYGISFKGIDVAQESGCTLIIALDCGIKSIDKIAYANERAIDFIICDHHLPGDELPNAVAILDPKRSDCDYPFKELCGCGIGFKVIQALALKMDIPHSDLVLYLDLVATAVGADIVPMTGENRIFTQFGLEQINKHPRPGIKALTQSVKRQKLTITDVVFVLAPRINAAGRIKHGKYAVELLTEFDDEKAQGFAIEIEKFNAERKNFDKNITAQALQQISDQGDENAPATVVYAPNWHKGVIGIVASRLTETYYRPTVVFTKSGDVIAASARSVHNFDLYDALEKCSEHLIQFGGHMYAAGMTALPENWENFKKAFQDVVAEKITEDQKQPKIEVDLQIDFSEIDAKTVRLLQQMEPFGPQMLAPVFMSKKVFDTGFAKTMGSENEHLRMYVRQNEKVGFGAIAFGKGAYLSKVSNQKRMDLLYHIDQSEWNGQTQTQLRVLDLQNS